MVDFKELNDIANRAIAGEYFVFMSIHRHVGDDAVRISLEKGSTFSKIHMKVEGVGPTPSAAFEAALANFPPNPIGGHWDSKRLAPPSEDGVFTEVTE